MSQQLDSDWMTCYQDSSSFISDTNLTKGLTFECNEGQSSELNKKTSKIIIKFGLIFSAFLEGVESPEGSAMVCFDMISCF